MDSKPLYIPHSTVNYGSTGHNTNAVATYTIFVIHNGQSICEAFSVKALSTDTVDELKKLIKAAKARCSTITLQTSSNSLVSAFRTIRAKVHSIRSASSSSFFIMEAHSSDKIEMDDTQTSAQQQQQQPQQPPHIIVPLDTLTNSPTQTALALPSCPDQPAETNDLPYPVLPTITSNPISSYPALPLATPSSTNTEETLSYPLESLDVIEPLSNPLPLDPSTTLTLFCLIDGQSTKQTWSIKALPADTVDDLKKAVKAAQAPNFDHVAAGELHLRKVNIENDPESDTVPVNIKNVKYRELKPMDTVAEVYPQGTERKVVQLVVMKPVPKPDVGR
ncbi:hypothetical protein BG000_000524, partial [Podila horticola]